MRQPIRTIQLASGLLLSTLSTQAVTIGQAFTYDVPEVIFSDTNIVGNTNTWIPSITKTFDPFSGEPADLVSFTIEWDITYVATAQFEASSTGSINGSANGTYYVDGNAYASNGSGGGNGTSEVGESTDFTFTVFHTKTFLPSEAGATYDPAILSSVLGTDAFDLSWGSGNLGSFSSSGDLDSLSFVIDSGSSVKVTYTLVPEPATFGLLAGVFSLAFVMLRRR